MVIPTTGIVFLFGAFVFIFLSRRFYQNYKAENIHIAKLFSYSFLLLGLNYFITGIPCLFLIENQSVWRIIAPVYYSLILGGWFLFGYAVISTKFQKYTKFISILFWSLFLMFNSFFYLSHPQYSYINGSIDLKVESTFYFLISSLFMPLLIIPLITIFFLEAKKTKEKKVRIRTLGLGLTMCALFLGGIVDMLLLTIFKLQPIYSDFNWFIMFSILAITLILTWGHSRPKLVKKIQ